MILPWIFAVPILVLPMEQLRDVSAVSPLPSTPQLTLAALATRSSTELRFSIDSKSTLELSPAAMPPPQEILVAEPLLITPEDKFAVALPSPLPLPLTMPTATNVAVARASTPTTEFAVVVFSLLLLLAKLLAISLAVVLVPSPLLPNNVAHKLREKVPTRSLELVSYPQPLLAAELLVSIQPLNFAVATASVLLTMEPTLAVAPAPLQSLLNSVVEPTERIPELFPAAKPAVELQATIHPDKAAVSTTTETELSEAILRSLAAVTAKPMMLPLTLALAARELSLLAVT